MMKSGSNSLFLFLFAVFLLHFSSVSYADTIKKADVAEKIEKRSPLSKDNFVNTDNRKEKNSAEIVEKEPEVKGEEEKKIVHEEEYKTKIITDLDEKSIDEAESDREIKRKVEKNSGIMITDKEKEDESNTAKAITDNEKKIDAGEKKRKKEKKSNKEDEKLIITSHSLIADKKTNTVIFEGSVKARKGDTVIYGDKMVVKYTEQGGKVKEIHIYKNIRVIQGDSKITSDRAVYLAKKDKIIFTDNPKAEDGMNRITGSKIIYFINDERTIIENSRVLLHVEDDRERRDKGKEEKSIVSKPMDIENTAKSDEESELTDEGR